MVAPIDASVQSLYSLSRQRQEIAVVIFNGFDSRSSLSTRLRARVYRFAVSYQPLDATYAVAVFADNSRFRVFTTVDMTDAARNQVKDPMEQMISHVPTFAQENEEDAPFVFSPRVSSAVSRLKTRKFMKHIRSMFCCLAPATVPSTETSLTVTSPPAVFPSEIIIGEQIPEDFEKKTLVLDLDETLVHSSFSKVSNPDFIIPVDIEGRWVDIYVLKRPGLDDFLKHVCDRFEVVVFTASLSKYADPLLDLLDPDRRMRWRLFREACSVHRGTYVKDLTRLGRELSRTVIVDNSPLSYVFQPDNALPITGFTGDKSDTALSEMIPLLDDLNRSEDVRAGLRQLLGSRPEAAVERQSVELEQIAAY